MLLLADMPVEQPDTNRELENRIEIAIRVAQASDLPRIYQLMCHLEERELDPKVFKQKYTSNLRRKNIYYFVAVQSDAVIGFISLHIQSLLHHDGPVAEIQELVVDPAARSQGTGKRLVDRARQIAFANRCESFEVTTNKKRVRTREFYEKNGLVSTHVKLTASLPTELSWRDHDRELSG
jgi:PhnO protein